MRSQFLLDRLDKLKPRGNGQYMARCPAHPDRTASLSVKCCDDGRVLIHCFAGCTADDVLGAVGLELKDIMPEPLGHHFAPTKNRISRADALAVLESETMLVAVVASDILESRTIDEATWQRFAKAAARLNEVASMTRE